MNQKGVLVPLAAKIHVRVDEITLSWFLEATSFDPVCSFIMLKRLSDLVGCFSA